MALLLMISYCRVTKEPGKVWNLRGKITTLAKSLAGLPYKYGGDEINGFDCSGFVYYVYDSFGIKLPRTAKKQAKLKGKIKFKYAKPGDILAFRLKRRWHTAIYVGKHSFIHAPNKKSRVRTETLNKFWKRRLKHAISLINE
ncbi:MAG: C40 family peptidase [bacterium]|nr:C40 family peptidase [bacterium]